MIKFFPIGCLVVSMLHLTLAEAALERVPKPLWSHPSVVKKARKEGKGPGSILLDRTYHHRAMLKLERRGKRGRPDIVHFSLLEALGTPLNKEGLLKTHVHTIDDHIINLDREVRLPRNYDRFVGLMEQLYELGELPPKGPALLRLGRGTFRELIKEIKPSHVIAFSRVGEPKTLQEVFSSLRTGGELMVAVGAFPRGHFSKTVLDIADEVVSIDVEGLEAWTVTSRIIYEYEKALGLPEKRLGKR